MSCSSTLARARAAASTSTKTSLAPARAKLRAMPNPMPLPPPVMNAVRPCTSLILVSPPLVFSEMDFHEKHDRKLRPPGLFPYREIACQKIDHVLAILFWILFPQLAVSCTFPNPDRLWLARLSEKYLHVVRRHRLVCRSLHQEHGSRRDLRDCIDRTGHPAAAHPPNRDPGHQRYKTRCEIRSGPSRCDGEDFTG